MSKHWTDKLPSDVWIRFYFQENIREDIEVLVNARWDWIKEEGKEKEGYTKADAIAYIMGLLRSNDVDFNLSIDEYNKLCKEDV